VSCGVGQELRKKKKVLASRNYKWGEMKGQTEKQDERKTSKQIATNSGYSWAWLEFSLSGNIAGKSLHCVHIWQM